MSENLSVYLKSLPLKLFCPLENVVICFIDFINIKYIQVSQTYELMNGGIFYGVITIRKMQTFMHLLIEFHFVVILKFKKLFLHSMFLFVI